MKKTTISIFLAFCTTASLLISPPALAAETTSPADIHLSTQYLQKQERKVFPFETTTISNNTSKYFGINNGQILLPSNTTAKFTCKFNRSAKVQIGFYNAATGTSKSLYSGTTSSKTVSYTPSSKVTGYFYIKNLSGSSLTVSSASITY